MRITDQITVGSIPARGSKTVATRQFPMTKTRLASGYYWRGGGRTDSEDEIEGIWIRLYAGDHLITEEAQPASLPRRHAWEC